jgi:hypothetical protein
MKEWHGDGGSFLTRFSPFDMANHTRLIARLSGVFLGISIE